MKRNSFILLVGTSLVGLIVWKFIPPTAKPDAEPKLSQGQPRLVVRPNHDIGTPQDPARRISFWKGIDDAPSWTVPYGAEFWRYATEAQAAAPSGAAVGGPRSENLNIGDIIARVSHAISEESPAESGMASGRDFHVKFDAEGFQISVLSSPTRPRQSEASFRTLSILSGEDLLYARGSRALEWSVLGNTAQAALDNRASLIEHYETTDKGVEVTWVLKEKPVSAGDLKIKGYFSGLRFRNESSSGYLFSEGGDSAAVQVSHATLVDSSGTRSPVAVVPSDDVFEVTVPEKLLLTSTFPIAIDPTVGPEFGVDACMSTNAQKAPAIAWNNTNYLVVWADGRYSTNQEQPFDIYGARVSPSGVLLDPAGLAISTALHGQLQPHAASNGKDYMVVWSDSRSGPESSLRADIYVSRVGWDGSVLDTGGVVVCSVDWDQSEPDIASNGTNYLVVWMDTRTSHAVAGGEVYGARISASGTVLETNGFRIGGNPNNLLAFFPHVASDGSDYLVVWHDTDDDFVTGSFGTRVTSAGVVLDGQGFTIATNSFTPALAYARAATNYLVVYGRGTGPVIYGNRVTTKSGVSLLDGTGIPISTNQPSWSVGSNGTNYLTVWSGEHDQGIFGLRIRATDGALLDTNAVTLSSLENEVFELFVAGGNGEFLVAWSDQPPADSYTNQVDIYAMRVSDAGAPLTYIPVSTAGPNSNSETRPAIAGAGTSFLLVWANQGDILGTRLGTQGEVRDPCGIQIAVSSVSEDRPSAAWNGSDFLVTWLKGRSILGTRVNTSGSVVDVPAIAISTNTTTSKNWTAASGNGSDFLVVWHASDPGAGSVYGARVSGSGTNLDPSGVAIRTNSAPIYWPAVASFGTNYLVAWTDNRNSGSSSLDIYGARVTGGGVVSDPNGFVVCNFTSDQSSPAIAVNSSNYFVVWADGRIRQTGSSTGVFGSRVTPAGQVLDPNGFQVYTNEAVVSYPAVASTGDDFLVVYQIGGSFSDVLGSRVTGSASVLDAGGFTIAGQSSSQSNPKICASGTKYFVVDQSSETGTSKVRAQIVTP